MNPLYNVYNKLIKQVAIWKNRYFFSSFRIEIKKGIPRVIIPDTYEKSVQLTLKIIFILGILGIFIAFPPPYSWFLSLFLLLLEQIIERISFEFISIYIQPTTRWEGLSAISYIIEKKTYTIGLVVKDEAYGRELLKNIRGWNYGNDDDPDNNINISFVIEDNREFTIYLYPSSKRASIREAKEEIDLETFKSGKRHKHRQLIATIYACQTFPYYKDSALNKFKSIYKTGDPFNLGIYIVKKETPELEKEKPFLDVEGRIQKITGISQITKYHIKIKNRKDLTEKDTEFFIKK